MQSIQSNLNQIPTNPEKKIIGHIPFVIDGDFKNYGLFEPSGETRKFTAVAMTAINSNTFNAAEISKAIKEKRLVNVITLNEVIVEVNIHPSWMNVLEEKNAWDIVIRTDKNKDYIWPKSNPTLGIASLETEENYKGMIRLLRLENFIK